MPYPASYVLIENINYDDNVKIYYDNELIDFSIISKENNKVKINLKKARICDKLLFYVDTNDEYTISLYIDLSFEQQTLSKTIKNEKVSTPDSTWITSNTKTYLYFTNEKINESDITKLLSETINCSYKEKYIYKYEVTKEYYDNNYYLNIDGYIKDINDYKIYYKGEPITNTIEIIQEKIVEVPKIEYMYIEKEIKENDSSKQTECPEKEITETVIETKTEFVEKEIFKIPKQVYIIIFMLLIVSALLAIKLLYIKYVE